MQKLPFSIICTVAEFHSRVNYVGGASHSSSNTREKKIHFLGTHIAQASPIGVPTGAKLELNKKNAVIFTHLHEWTG